MTSGARYFAHWTDDVTGDEARQDDDEIIRMYEFTPEVLERLAEDVEISDITERLNFSGAQRNLSEVGNKAETTIRLDQENDLADISMADEHRLLYTAMEGLRVTAESAIARAETAEAKLVAQTAALASPKDAVHQGLDLQRALAGEVKAVIAAEVKKAVQAAVDEATSELRAVVAEARQLRDAVKPSADMMGDFHAAFALTRGSNFESNKLSLHSEDDRDRECELEGREAIMMMAMKAVAHQVLGRGSKSMHVSPSISTDDTHSSATLAGASRTQSAYSSMPCSSRASSAGDSPSHGDRKNDIEVNGSARLVDYLPDFGSPQILKEAPLPVTPKVAAESSPQEEPAMCAAELVEEGVCALANPSDSCTPQRSVSLPGLTPSDAEAQQKTTTPRRVRDVVSQFERILPGRGQAQQEGPLAPWPFAPVTRSKNISVAATPWTTSFSAVPRRPARTASLSSLH
jgi:hypothetical protein